MAICKNCGANIDESAKFCTTCGQPNTPSMPTMDTTESGSYTEPTYTEPTQQQGSTNYGQTSYNGGNQQTNYGQSSYNGGYQQPQQNTYQQNAYQQPNYNGGAYQQPMYNAQPVAPQGDKMNICALLGFIFSIVCCGGLPGLVLSIVGLIQINKNGGKGKGLAIAGIVLFAVGTIISIIFMATGGVEKLTSSSSSYYY